MSKETVPVSRRVTGLYTIIAIKLGKGVLLILIALGVYSLMGDDLRLEFDQFLRWINIDPEHQFFSDLGRKIQRITPDNIRWVAWGTLLYGSARPGPCGSPSVKLPSSFRSKSTS